MRKIRAIRRGYFAFPGSRHIAKSYGYIYGFLESVVSAIGSGKDLLVYNHVEFPTEPLGALLAHVRRFWNSRAPIFSVPVWVLVPLATAFRALLGRKSPLHPVRVWKAGTPTPCPSPRARCSPFSGMICPVQGSNGARLLPMISPELPLRAL